MFASFRTLTAPQRRNILIAMLILIVPISIYTVTGAVRMHRNKVASVEKYDQKIEISDEQMDALVIPPTSREVRVGIYMESIYDISVKDDSWKAKFLLWFAWEGDEWEPRDYPGNRFIVGNGLANSKLLLDEYHEDGVHYQQYRVIATMEKYFDTMRYPLDSHQLKVFIEDERDMSEVRYVPDTDNSALSPYLNIAGFSVINHDTGLYLNEYSSNMGHPALEKEGFEGKKTFEYVFVTRVNRAGFSLFLKAFLSLLGILLWVCIGLYDCAYNQTNAMGAINTGIFGVVSSMIVGMNLLSDARGAGLIEYINFFSLAMILLATIYVIRINRFRARGEDGTYIACYAKSLFWVTTVMSVCTIAMFVLSALH